MWLGADSMGRQGAMLQFMILTACRLKEVRQAEYPHIRLDDAVLGAHWTQPAHLTKNHREHRVPMAEPLVRLLRWLPRAELHDGSESPLVFAGRAGKAIGFISRIRETARLNADVEEGTLHDLRRTMVSALGDHGFDPQVADSLLNHSMSGTMSGVMGTYQRSDFWVRKQEAIKLYSDLVVAEVEKINDGPWKLDQPFVTWKTSSKDKAKATLAAGRLHRSGS